jgi:non-specific serine/threonine protein kinase
MLDRPAEARTVVAKGLPVWLRSHDVVDLTASLDASAEIAFELGAPERAMRLIGAVDVIRRRAESEPNPFALRSRNRWIPRAERQLGKRAHTAWLEGCRLTADEAGAHALAPLDQAPAGDPSESTPGLSGRESQIVELVASGLTNDEIAAQLRLSARTVEAHLDHIRTKLGLRSRVEVATWFSARSTPQPAWRS